MATSRRLFLQGLGSAAMMALATGGCSVLSEGASPLESMVNLFEPNSLRFAPTKIFEENLWIEDEIRQFLSQRDVLDVLGRDPQNYDRQINVIISDSSITMGHGLTNDVNIDLNGVMYLPKHYSKKEIAQAVHEQYSKDYRQNYADEFNHVVDLRTEELYRSNLVLVEDLEFARIYRNLLVAHELSHAFANTEIIYDKDGKVINNYAETGHGVTNRTEIKIATNLYKSGKISKEMWGKIFDYHLKYKNNDKESDKQVLAYRRNVLAEDSLPSG